MILNRIMDSYSNVNKINGRMVGNGSETLVLQECRAWSLHYWPCRLEEVKRRKGRTEEKKKPAPASRPRRDLAVSLVTARRKPVLQDLFTELTAEGTAERQSGATKSRVCGGPADGYLLRGDPSQRGLHWPVREDWEGPLSTCRLPQSCQSTQPS